MDTTLDNKAIRRDNLIGLIATLDAGNMSAFGRRTNTDPSLLSQYKNGTRKMGDGFARKLELALDKEKGWMDHPQFRQSEISIEQAEAAQIAEALDPEERAAWLKHGRLLVQSKSPPGTAANPFGDVPRHKGVDERTTAGASVPARSPKRKGTQ